MLCLPDSALQRSCKDDGCGEDFSETRVLPWIGLSAAGFVAVAIGLTSSQNNGGSIDPAAKVR